MFPDVQSSLRLDQHGAGPKQVLILEDEDHMGAFLVSHFLHTALDSQAKVVFLGVEQSLGHYHALAMKSGLSLLKAREAGQLHFMELLKVMSQQYGGDATEGAFWESSGQPRLQAIYSAIHTPVARFDRQEPWTLIVDKLSLFHALGSSESELVFFFTYLRNLAITHRGSLVIRCRRDPQSEDLDDLATFAAFRSDLVIRTWPLSTGQSMHVTGNLEYDWHDPSEQGRYQFLLDDKTVRVFALGTSQAVL